jgi:hypothetical protein
MIERIIKHTKIVYKWITGLTIELIYPFITFSIAAIICFLFYITVLLKNDTLLFP